MRFARTAIVVIAAALPSLAAPDLDAEAGFEALRKGGVQDAKARFEAVIKRNPSDCAAAIARASTLPPADALKAMDSLSRAQGAPGWAKARSLRFLGDHRFAKGEYGKAADFYQQASKFDNSSEYRHLYALSAAMDGSTDAARSIWAAIAEDRADAMSAEASSLLQCMQGSSKVPLECGGVKVSVGGSGGPPPPLPPPVAPVNSPSASVNPPPAATSAGQQVVYTVQVGAFGSKENADNLVRRLVETYSDIYVSPTTSGDQTLYRVRVGSFARREDADSLANRLLTGAGLSARVFEK
jgi:cell division septation protein DedD